MKMLSILTLHLSADRVPAVLTYYRDERVLERSGAESGQILVADIAPGTVTVVASWNDPESYADWLASPLRAEFSSGIAAACGSPVESESQEFRVIHES